MRKLHYLVAVLLLVNLATLSIGQTETTDSRSAASSSEKEIIDIFTSDKNPKELSVELINLIQTNHRMAAQTRNSCIRKLEEIGQTASRRLIYRLKSGDKDAEEFLIQKSDSNFLRSIFEQEYKREKEDLNLLDEIAIPPDTILNMIYSQESGLDEEETIFAAAPIIADKLKGTGNDQLKDALILFFENVEVEIDGQKSKVNFFRIYEEPGMSDDLHGLLSGTGIKVADSPLNRKEFKSIKASINEISGLKTSEEFDVLKQQLELLSNSLDAKKSQDEIKEALRNAVPDMVYALGSDNERLVQNVRNIIACTSGISTYELFKIYSSLEDGSEQKKEVRDLLTGICGAHNDLISRTMIDLYMDYDLETDEISEAEYVASMGKLLEHFSHPQSVSYGFPTNVLESIKTNLKDEIGELPWDNFAGSSQNIKSVFTSRNYDLIISFREKEPVLTEYIVDELIRRLDKSNKESFKANTLLSYYFDDVSVENLINAYQEGNLRKPAADVLSNIGWKAVPDLIDHSNHRIIEQILTDKTIPELVKKIALNSDDDKGVASGIYQSIVDTGIGDSPVLTGNRSMKLTYYSLLIFAVFLAGGLWSFFARQLNKSEQEQLHRGGYQKGISGVTELESPVASDKYSTALPEISSGRWGSNQFWQNDVKLKFPGSNWFNGFEVSGEYQRGNNRGTDDPVIEQLKFMGWEHVRGDIGCLTLSERETFKETLLKGRLKRAIERVNPQREGYRKVEADEIDRSISRLENSDFLKLITANNEITELLLKGVYRGESHAGKENRIKFIDFENPENNKFLAVSKFRVDDTDGKNSIVPNVVLFVN
ncbi:MAG: type I restriction endonuclease, partial [bacterium]